MSTLVVVNDRELANIPDVEVIRRSFLSYRKKYYEMRKAQVFNLCRPIAIRASATMYLWRPPGHKPQPSITTIQDMKTISIARLVWTTGI